MDLMTFPELPFGVLKEGRPFAALDKDEFLAFENSLDFIICRSTIAEVCISTVYLRMNPVSFFCEPSSAFVAGKAISSRQAFETMITAPKYGADGALIDAEDTVIERHDSLTEAVEFHLKCRTLFEEKLPEHQAAWEMRPYRVPAHGNPPAKFASLIESINHEKITTRLLGDDKDNPVNDR